MDSCWNCCCAASSAADAEVASGFGSWALELSTSLLLFSKIALNMAFRSDGTAADVWLKSDGSGWGEPVDVVAPSLRVVGVDEGL